MGLRVGAEITLHFSAMDRAAGFDGATKRNRSRSSATARIPRPSTVEICRARRDRKCKVISASALSHEYVGSIEIQSYRFILGKWMN